MLTYFWGHERLYGAIIQIWLAAGKGSCFAFAFSGDRRMPGVDSLVYLRRNWWKKVWFPQKKEKWKNQELYVSETTLCCLWHQKMMTLIFGVCLFRQHHSKQHFNRLHWIWSIETEESTTADLIKSRLFGKPSSFLGGIFFTSFSLLKKCLAINKRFNWIHIFFLCRSKAWIVFWQLFPHPECCLPCYQNQNQKLIWKWHRVVQAVLKNAIISNCLRQWKYWFSNNIVFHKAMLGGLFLN